MKNIFIFLIYGWIGCSLASCYEDKGNYDYTDRGDIILKGWVEKYTVTSITDTLDITPGIDRPEDYDYLWLMYKSGVSFNYDTVGAEYRLLMPVVQSPGNYKLFLKATAHSDGCSALFSADVVVTSEYSDGWFVVKESEGNTDLDFFTLDARISANILSQSMGRPLMGKPLKMTMMPEFAYLSPEGEIVWGLNFCDISSEEDCWIVNLQEMSLVRDFSELFFTPVSGEKPRVGVAPDGYFRCYFTDRNAYYANAQGPGTGQMGQVYGFKTEIEPGKCCIRSNVGTVFYDQKNNRFLGITYQGGAIIFSEDPKVPGVTPPATMNNTGCKMDYMGMNKFKSEFFYAVMANANKPEKYIYTLYAPSNAAWDAEDQRGMGEYSLIYAVDTIAAGLEINESTLFAIGTNLPYIYCNDASGNAVHYYDVAGRHLEKNVFPIPEGEKVTFIKSLYFDADQDWNESNDEDAFDKFVIATEKEGQYKIYFYDLLAGKPIGEPLILRGEGKVYDVSPIRTSFNRSVAALLPANY